MLNVKKIETEMSNKKINKTTLCSTTGIARTTLDAILNGSDAKISTIELISKALNLKMGFLFDEDIAEIRNAGRDYYEKSKIGYKGSVYNGNCTSEADLRDQIAQLKSQLADKERIIKLMESKNES